MTLAPTEARQNELLWKARQILKGFYEDQAEIQRMMSFAEICAILKEGKGPFRSVPQT
jgi:hypothetical protein